MGQVFKEMGIRSGSRHSSKSRCHHDLKIHLNMEVNEKKINSEDFKLWGSVQFIDSH
jgi:hypothetical protein